MYRRIASGTGAREAPSVSRRHCVGRRRRAAPRVLSSRRHRTDSPRVREPSACTSLRMHDRMSHARAGKQLGYQTFLMAGNLGAGGPPGLPRMTTVEGAIDPPHGGNVRQAPTISRVTRPMGARSAAERFLVGLWSFAPHMRCPRRPPSLGGPGLPPRGISPSVG